MSELEKELAVVSIDLNGGIIDLGAAAAKAMPSMNRHRYKQLCKLTLSDGQVIDYEVRALTKPKLRVRIAADERHVKTGAMFARPYIGFEDKQLHWGIITRMTFKIGG